jgi:ArsR family transcriptional regulator
MNIHIFIKERGMERMDCKDNEIHEERIEQAREELLRAEDIEKECNLFRMLAEPSRMKIVLALTKGESCVYHLVGACGGTQSGMSHQLRVLKDNGIVKSRRAGQNMLYSLADEHIVKIVELAREHKDCK